MRTEKTDNLVHVDFRRGALISQPTPERTEAAALDYLAQLRWEQEGGAVDGSLGPLLALSLLELVGALRGEQLGQLVGDLVRGLARGGMQRDAAEVARSAAAGFVRGGDHQVAADLLEMSNTLGAAAQLGA